MPRTTIRAAQCVASILALLATGHASAEVVYAVDSVLDEVDDDTADMVCHTATNTCTLRAAVMQANKVTGADIVIELPAGVYLLTIAPVGGDLDDSGDLNVTTPTVGGPLVTIKGAGAGVSIIDAAQGGRIMRIAVSRSVSLRDVTLRNGRTTPADNGGGAIDNLGELFLDGCAFSSNTALPFQSTIVFGGAIKNSGWLKAYRTTFSGNVTTGSGGALFNAAGAQADVRQCAFSGNVAMGFFASGGAISNSGALLVSNTTISGNFATNFGGGISNSGAGNLNLYNATIVYNEADTDANGLGTGGGLSNTATMNVRNDIVAFNTRAQIPEDCVGAIAAYGNNHFGGVPATCTLTQTGPGVVSLVNSANEIAPLQDNGGPTLTRALVPSSTMIDGAEPTVGCIQGDGQTLLEDQRGYKRSIGARCDVGAFEYGATSRDSVLADGFETQPFKGLVINEVDYDQPGTDGAEFIEVYNGGAADVGLGGLALVLVNGTDDAEYARVELGSAGTLAPGQYLVVRTLAVALPLGALSVLFPGASNQIQNGSPDGIALIRSAPALLIDALSYEGSITGAVIAGFGAPVDLVEGTPILLSEADSDVATASLVRYPNGADSNNAFGDWQTSQPTPGASNQ